MDSTSSIRMPAEHHFSSIAADKKGKIELPNIKQFPQISEASAKVFQELGHEVPTKLEAKVQTLKASIEQLNDQKQIYKKEKIFSLLRAALYVGLVAGALLAIPALAVVCPPAAIIAIIGVSYLGITALGSYIVHRAEPKRNLGDVLLLSISVIGPPIYALYEIEQKKEKVQMQEEKVQLKQEDYQKELELVIKFYESNFEPARNMINEQIEQLKDAPDPARQKTLEKALEELDHAYQQYLEMKKAE